MYAIIRVGGKQAKVKPGDIIDVERIKSGDEQVSYIPLLVVDEKGDTITDRDELAKMLVTAKVLGESRGPKVDIFKYKNKTGYRRRQGHRQTYTTIEVTGIETSEKAAKAGEAKKAETAAEVTGIETPEKTAKADEAKTPETAAEVTGIETSETAAEVTGIETPEKTAKADEAKKAETAPPEEK